MITPPPDGVSDGREGLWNATRAVLRSQRNGPPFEPVSRDATLAASFAQQRIWFLERFAPGIPLYNLTVAFRMTGLLSILCLEKSLSEMLRRHEVLRTTLRFMDGQLVQRIHQPVDLELPVVDLRNLDAPQREGEARREAEAEARDPFELERPPLMRARLFRLTDREHLLVLTMHHLAFDGWSFDIFMRELCGLYGAFSEGKPSPLSKLRLQYADFAAWQRRWLDGDVLAPLLDYWKRQMDGSLPVLRLPSDHSRKRTRTYRGGCQRLTLPKDLTEALKRLSANEGVTTFTTLLAAFQVLLHRYTGEEDVIVGSPVANRNRVETHDIIGLFVNTLAFRTRIEGHVSFRELLARARGVVLGAYTHQDLPFEVLVDALDCERLTNAAPVFQVMFGYQNVPRSSWTLPGLTVDAWNVENGTAKFDVTLVMWEAEEGFCGSLEYDAELFDAATISEWIDHFRILLDGIVQNPDERIAMLPLLSAADKRRVLQELNETEIDYPRDMTVHQLFEAQVQATPETAALVISHREITYRELDRRANRLARYLARLQVRTEMLVGVSLEPSLELIVSLLAILKTGAAFLPIDPSTPEDYLVRALKSAALPIVVTERSMESRLFGLNAKIVSLDSDREEIDHESDEPLQVEVCAENLAYVMYTSGSTGMPNGVCVSHRAVVRLVKGANYASLTPEDVFLQLAPVSFDASTFEIWGSLLNGARLVLPSSRRYSLEEISQAICRDRVSVLFLTTGLFELLVDTHLMALGKVRQLLVGGDVLSVPHVERFLLQAQGCRLIHCYGPTENTTFTSFHAVERRECGAGEPIPIGRPISNTVIYVLDSFQQPVPIGVAGEAYVGGDGLMRCYFNDPELTRERLVPDPFCDRPGAFLYKTGDLVRLQRDGSLQFVGRIDDQVKIRGFRVEPAEVEAALSACPLVKRVAVIGREFAAGGKRLTAYVVPDAAEGSRDGEIISIMRDFMRERLPHYLVPSELVLLESLPLNHNGKVDRRALPVPAANAVSRGKDFVVPRDEIERGVSQAFEQALGVQGIGVHDSFFELGGDSLSALRLFAMIESTFNTSLPLVSLFEHPTIAELAVLLRTREKPITPGSALVEIKRGRSEMPFFLVPGGHGGMAEMTLYAKLMSYLDREQPVYGLLSSNTSVAERAAIFIREIRRQQPRGPYALGGECVGGVVAFEMAQQLIAQGQKVALLLLMDTWCPIDAGSFRGRFFDRPLAILRSRRLVVRAGFSNLRRMLRDRLRHQPRFRAVRWLYYWLDVALTLKQKTASWVCALKNVEATMRYRPQPYPGRLTLLISSGNDQKGLCRDWRRLSKGGLVVHTVPGDHESYIRDTPEATAKRLRILLDETTARR